MKKHYICLGGCRGVSEILGVCQAPDCANHKHELVECKCTDGLHYGFKGKLKAKVILGSIVFLLVLLFSVAFFVGEPPLDNGIACTMEAKICPDGSAVGRTGPLCEFEKCPDEGTVGSVGEFWGSIYGNVLLGPVCPVEMNPPDPKCADRPYQTRLVVTTPDGLSVIKEFSSDEDGKFNIEVRPGEYMISPATTANILPSCASSDTFKVDVNDSVEITINCDSGIR